MAARTVCPACSNHTFELAAAKVTGSVVAWDVIRCAKCGAAITFVPTVQVNALIERLAKALKIKL